MTTPLLTLVLPIYNVEPFLQRCLDSIVTQEVWSAGVCELILINDGSSDGSEAVALAFKERYPEVVYIAQENRGLGAARNRATEVARGKYIEYIDTDDYLYPNALQPILELALKTKADILGFHTIAHFDNNTRKLYNPTSCPSEVTLGVEVMARFNAWGGACTYLFRREFLLQHQLFMPVGIYHEDELFITRCFYYAQRVVGCKIPLYAYCIHADTITTSQDRSKQLKRIEDMSGVIEQLAQFAREHSHEPWVTVAFAHKLSYLAIELLRMLLRFGCSDAQIAQTTERLHRCGLYPLAYRPYSLRYTIYWLLLGEKWRLQLAKRLGLKR